MSGASSKECMQGAFQALLNGDLAERDRLCERAKILIEAEQYSDAVEKVMAVDFYVTSLGLAIPTKEMARAAHAVH